MNMEFQPLPPVSTMNIGPPTPSPSPHIQILSNGPNGNGPAGVAGGGGPGGGHNGMGPGNNGVHSQLLGPMPPPSILPIGMPLQQVVHNLQHLTNVGGLGMGGNPQQQQQQQQQPQHQQQQHQQQQQTHQNLLTSNTPGANGLTGIHHGGTQNLPPTSQLLQAIHQNTSNNNNNGANNNNNNNNTINLNNNSNSNGNNNNNSITQYQVQQLWRHHAYLNVPSIFGTY
uniref:Uncharacterized protein n=1 Tax=Anopheles stephensi TaxID=30069 RepID=A0A182YLU4_ANOST